jgi:hypothetical protein
MNKQPITQTNQRSINPTKRNVTIKQVSKLTDQQTNEQLNKQINNHQTNICAARLGRLCASIFNLI